jgi:hypothetical protein
VLLLVERDSVVGRLLRPVADFGGVVLLLAEAVVHCVVNVRCTVLGVVWLVVEIVVVSTLGVPRIVVVGRGVRVVTVVTSGTRSVAGGAVIRRVGVVSVTIVGLVVGSVVDAVSVGGPLVSVVVTGPCIGWSHVITVTVCVIRGNVAMHISVDTTVDNGGSTASTIDARVGAGTIWASKVVVNSGSSHVGLGVNVMGLLGVDMSSGFMTVVANGVLSLRPGVLGQVRSEGSVSSISSTISTVNGTTGVDTFEFPLSGGSVNGLGIVHGTEVLHLDDLGLVPVVLGGNVSIVMSIEMDLRVLVVRLHVVAHLPVLTWNIGNGALVDTLDRLASLAIATHVAVLADNVLSGVLVTVSISMVAVVATVSITGVAVSASAESLVVTAKRAERWLVLGIGDKCALVAAGADGLAEVGVTNGVAKLVSGGNGIVLRVVV